MNNTLDSRFSFNDYTILSIGVDFKEVHPFPNCTTSVNVSVLNYEIQLHEKNVFKFDFHVSKDESFEMIIY